MMKLSKEILIGGMLALIFILFLAITIWKNLPSQHVKPTSSAITTVTPTQGSYTMTEVAKHNSASNCWFVINGKVYDVTSYEDQHPGGSQNIIGNCGTDATEAYKSIPKHGARADAELAKLLIGSLSK